jgi:Fungalysin metallopeptidase (M36)
MLDERNAILAADQAAGTGLSTKLWQVFASRGMGVNASTNGPDDTSPVQDFHTPPPPAPTPTPTPSPTPTPTPVPITPISPIGHLTIAKQKVRKALSRGFSLKLRSDRTATASITISLDRKLAKRLKQKKAAGKATVTLTAGVTKTVRVRLTGLSRKVKAKLRKLRSISLKITVKLTDQATGGTSTTRKTVKLKR